MHASSENIFDEAYLSFTPADSAARMIGNHVESAGTHVMLKLPRNPNLTELAYLSVKRQLLNGSLPEGSKLTEEYLAAQLGISKSPVREALMRLESEGLICIEARRGAYVRKFSVKEVQDLYALRELLEVHAIGIMEITPNLLLNMAASIEHTRDYIASGDKLGHIEEDIRFHSLIAVATNNVEFSKLLDNIQQKSLLCRMATFYLSAVSAPLSHQQILLALSEGNRERAQKAMRDHIVFVRDSLLNSIMNEPNTLLIEGDKSVA